MESSAQDHAALGEAIRRELETPLAEFIDYQYVILRINMLILI